VLAETKPPRPPHTSEYVTYVSQTPFGRAFMPASVEGIQGDRVTLRIYCDNSHGSEWFDSVPYDSLASPHSWHFGTPDETHPLDSRFLPK